MLRLCLKSCHTSCQRCICAKGYKQLCLTYVDSQAGVLGGRYDAWMTGVVFANLAQLRTLQAHRADPPAEPPGSYGGSFGSWLSTMNPFRSAAASPPKPPPFTLQHVQVWSANLAMLTTFASALVKSKRAEMLRTGGQAQTHCSSPFRCAKMLRSLRYGLWDRYLTAANWLGLQLQLHPRLQPRLLALASAGCTGLRTHALHL